MLPETQSTERRVTQKACDSLRHYIEAASQLWQSPTCLIKTNFNLSNSVVSGSDAIVIPCCSTLANSMGPKLKTMFFDPKCPKFQHAHAASYLCLRYIWSCRGEHETGDSKLVSLLLEAHISSTWSCGMCNKHNKLQTCKLLWAANGFGASNQHIGCFNTDKSRLQLRLKYPANQEMRCICLHSNAYHRVARRMISNSSLAKYLDGICQSTVWGIGRSGLKEDEGWWRLKAYESILRYIIKIRISSRYITHLSDLCRGSPIAPNHSIRSSKPQTLGIWIQLKRKTRHARSDENPRTCHQWQATVDHLLVTSASACIAHLSNKSEWCYIDFTMF